MVEFDAESDAEVDHGCTIGANEARRGVRAVV